jgi:hypothetical protein
MFEYLILEINDLYVLIWKNMPKQLYKWPKSKSSALPQADALPRAAALPQGIETAL